MSRKFSEMLAEAKSAESIPDQAKTWDEKKGRECNAVEYAKYHHKRNHALQPSRHRKAMLSDFRN